MSADRVGLVVGARGVIGRHVVQHLETTDGWRPIALSRNEPSYETDAAFVSVDLLDSDAAEDTLSDLDEVTHVFYAAYLPREDLHAEAETNREMLSTLLDGLSMDALERVVLYQGVKYYGVHHGEFTTPAREDDPRHLPPNLYYAQEDLLKTRAEGASWDWTLLRPDVICGVARDNAMNIAKVIGVYAAISNELGVPLRYPGSRAASGVLMQTTDAGLLARASDWAATNDACGQEAFNITNGGLFRWESLWPKIADYFEMPVGTPTPVSLESHMADKGMIWELIAEKHGLDTPDYDSFVEWGFGDFVFNCEYDVVSDVTKCRQYGFGEAVDSEASFYRVFDEYRERDLLP